MKTVSMIPFVAAVLAFAGLSATTSLAADLYPTASSAVQDSVMMDARPGEYYYNLAADAVRHRDYSHAIEMYLVSASWAYKTSEFNLGVMYARGEGVAVDLPRALAWMALSAERNDKQYLQARDLVASKLDKNGLSQAEAILQQLLPTYGDAVALNRAKSRWREVRNQATGSHVGFTGNLSVGSSGGGEIGKSQLGPVDQAAERKFVFTGKEGGHAGNLTVNEGLLNTGVQNAAGVVGTSGVDGSKVYADLRMTDNPYDPRFGSGVATVGQLAPAGEKKPAAEQPKKDAAAKPADSTNP